MKFNYSNAPLNKICVTLSLPPPLSETTRFANILGKGMHLQVSAEGQTPVIIDSGGNEFEIITASEGHPYCKRMEDFFVLDGSNQRMSPPLDVEVVLYLRDIQTLEFKQTRFRARIAVKSTGAHLAIIVDPSELAGLICTPPTPRYPYSIVARPFNMGYLNYARNDSVMVTNEFAKLTELRLPTAPWIPNMSTVLAMQAAPPRALPTTTFPRMLVTTFEAFSALEQSIFELPSNLRTLEDRNFISIPCPHGISLEEGFLGRFCVSAGASGLGWLRIPESDRSGVNFDNADLKDGLYRELLWGNLSCTESGLYFSPDISLPIEIDGLLPRLWFGKEQSIERFRFDFHRAVFPRTS